MILLTDQERDKFATYLEQQAASGTGIMEQMLRLDGIPEALIKRIKSEAVAQMIVARMLRMVETQSL